MFCWKAYQTSLKAALTMQIPQEAPDNAAYGITWELSVQPEIDDGIILMMDNQKVGHISSNMLIAAAKHDELVVPERIVD